MQCDRENCEETAEWYVISPYLEGVKATFVGYLCDNCTPNWVQGKWRLGLAKARAAELLRDRYEQTSRKYRTVARARRLHGLSYLETLAEIDPGAHERILAHAEYSAQRSLLLNSQGHDELKLNPAEFAEFVRLRGEAGL